MQEKCPVCGKIISANENKCSECGFAELHKTFISKIDAEEWIEKVVKPYKTKYEDNKNKANSQAKIQNTDEKNNNFQVLHLNDCTYTGEVLNGKRHGYGECVWLNGDKYCGQWLNDKAHGEGIFTYQNGDVYEGEIKNNMRNGYGSYKFPNGTVYRGEWLNDLRYGDGSDIPMDRKFMGPNGKICFEKSQRTTNNTTTNDSTLDEKTTRIIVIILWTFLTIAGLCSLASDGGGTLGAILLLSGFALMLYGPGKL